MPAISRHRDKCRTGHSCHTHAPVNASRETVFANGKNVLVRGDRVAPHTILDISIPACVLHPAKLRGSSRDVFAENIGIGRRGDRADFGRMVQASPNVFANGGNG